MNRALELGSITLALTGAGVGISLGMLFHSEPPFRVHLEDSLPLALLGTFVGALVGCGVSAACARRPRLIQTAALAFTALLGASISAPLGWIAGSIVASERLPHAEEPGDVKHLPPVGMVIGTGVGGVLGFALGYLQKLLESRSASAGRSGACGESDANLHR